MLEFKVPELGDSVEDCLLTAWLKKVGDTVTEGEPLVEVTTDKVTVELPAEQDGVVREILIEPGKKVRIGQTICMIEA